TLSAVIHPGNVNWAAIGESEFVAPERRNPPRIRRRRVIEVVACVERRVAHELEDRAVKATRSRACDDVGESGSSASYFGGHPAGNRLDLFHRVHVEVRERG